MDLFVNTFWLTVGSFVTHRVGDLLNRGFVWCDWEVEEKGHLDKLYI